MSQINFTIPDYSRVASDSFSKHKICKGSANLVSQPFCRSISFTASKGLITRKSWGVTELIHCGANYVIKLLNIKPGEYTPVKTCVDKLAKFVTVQGNPVIAGQIALENPAVKESIGGVVLFRNTKSLTQRNLHAGSNEVILPGDSFAFVNPNKRSAKIVEVVTDEMGGATLRAELLKKAKQRQVVEKCERPWGYYETFCTGSIKKGVPSFWIKELHVEPNQSLSLQYHKDKIERYIVAQGTATVRCAEDVREYPVGSFINIPTNCVHRLENKTSVPVKIVEVTTGKIKEDDIVRISDKYGRLS